MSKLKHQSVVVAAVHCLLAGVSLASGSGSSIVTLHWTAPGDNGSVGRAFAYDLRSSATLITEANFSSCTSITGLPAPQTAGTAETFSITNLVPGNTYYFALKTVDAAGNWSAISNVVLDSANMTPAGRTPLSLSFSGPWPNPARDAAHWSYVSPVAGALQIDAFDVTGRHVRTIAQGPAVVGTSEVSWDLRDDDGRAVAKGVYMVRASLGGRTWMNRVVVSR